MPSINFDIVMPFIEMLGFELLHKKDGIARVRLDPKPEHLNSWKSLHGGVVMTLLDVALSSAARSLDESCIGCATVEMKTNFLAGAGDKVIAEGRAQRAGRSLIFAEGELRDAAGAVLAKANGTFKLLYASTRESA
ncbi:MAG TPA: PaaI family thioesterase [Burkholderiales bacterium]|nr:PaaI family thioesterase [Burkholderiales bacterium]